jgi:hypothetical protein
MNKKDSPVGERGSPMNETGSPVCERGSPMNETDSGSHEKDGRAGKMRLPMRNRRARKRNAAASERLARASPDSLSPLTRGMTYGRVCGMEKTTLYVPKELKSAVERAAAERGCSEAELVREALRAFTSKVEPPAPRLPLFASGKPGLARRAQAELKGFGER